MASFFLNLYFDPRVEMNDDAKMGELVDLVYL